VVILGFTYGTNNGVGRTPAMGYNTWNDFRCNINEGDILASADAVVKQGLDKVGFVYVNIDDCWAKSREADGTIVPDAAAFPHGMKYVADYVHSKGLKFGIYTDRGTKTCAGRPGSQGYEKKDADTYASWGVDYLKEDSCYASSDHQTAFQQYGLMRDALNATRREIYFSLCGWNSWYAPEGWTLGNSWRIAGDCNTWPNVQNAIDTNVALTDYAKPGGWNDPDMLIGSDSSTAAHLTPNQSRTMFSLWAVMAAPLLIGSNIRNLNAWDLQTYSNSEIIAVDQDPAGRQGIRLAGGNLVNDASPFNVWGKKLQDGSAVLNFLNNNKTAQDIKCDGACFTALGFKSTDQLKVRDLWSHSDIGTITAGSGYTAKAVPETGGSVTLKFSM
jgi:alpha-galactosidase